MTELLATLATTLPLVLGGADVPLHSQATPERWSPFAERIALYQSRTSSFDQLFKDADDLLRHPFFGDFPTPGSFPMPSHWPTAWPRTWPTSQLVAGADVSETDDEVQVTMDLPGQDPKSLQVNVEGSTLTVKSERREDLREQQRGFRRASQSYGMFSRSVSLPSSVDPARGEAKYEQGVLTVTFPKRPDAERKTFTIEVHT